MDQLGMFGENIFLLIGILISLILGFILLISFWTGLRVWLFRRSQDEAERKERSGKLGRDGHPLPPKGMGICQQCQKAGPVFHLSDGRRFCESCFAGMPSAV